MRAIEVTATVGPDATLHVSSPELLREHVGRQVRLVITEADEPPTQEPHDWSKPASGPETAEDVLNKFALDWPAECWEGFDDFLRESRSNPPREWWRE